VKLSRVLVASISYSPAKPLLPCLPQSVCDKEVFVERFSFDADVAFTPREELLEHVTIADRGRAERARPRL
jgi:hypothetical protein